MTLTTPVDLSMRTDDGSFDYLSNGLEVSFDQLFDQYVVADFEDAEEKSINPGFFTQEDLIASGLILQRAADPAGQPSSPTPARASDELLQQPLRATAQALNQDAPRISAHHPHQRPSRTALSDSDLMSLQDVAQIYTDIPSTSLTSSSSVSQPATPTPSPKKSRSPRNRATASKTIRRHGPHSQAKLVSPAMMQHMQQGGELKPTFSRAWNQNINLPTNYKASSVSSSSVHSLPLSPPPSAKLSGREESQSLIGELQQPYGMFGYEVDASRRQSLGVFPGLPHTPLPSPSVTALHNQRPTPRPVSDYSYSSTYLHNKTPSARPTSTPNFSLWASSPNDALELDVPSSPELYPSQPWMANSVHGQVSQARGFYDGADGPKSPLEATGFSYPNGFAAHGLGISYSDSSDQLMAHSSPGHSSSTEYFSDPHTHAGSISSPLGSPLSTPQHARQRSASSRTPSPTSSSFRGTPKSGSKTWSGGRKKAPRTPVSGSPSAGGGGIGFVNFTPSDSRKILGGVAPSGSSKTKLKREKEQMEKRRKMSAAAVRAVELAGGDLGVLAQESQRGGFIL
ncbi:MAG: hypothetical protein M1817_002302 [Caeruleum heppii]|nr:MAG: hypothetical protein M1817_003514 [Caeruleum heppii]KAI9673665.1 MAG: hypothetical protein M1817_002302 [Caeruleum heppii]